MNRKSQAFSLVEVALALAAMTFCITALFGLLPVGIACRQNSEGEAGATRIMQALAAGLWSMGFDQQTNLCRILSPVQIPSFAIAQAPFSFSCGFTGNGTLCAVNDFANNKDLRGSIYIKIMPPVTRNAIGTAYVSAAWPGSARYSDNGWKNQSGQVHATVFFSIPQ